MTTEKDIPHNLPRTIKAIATDAPALRAYAKRSFAHAKRVARSSPAACDCHTHFQTRRVCFWRMLGKLASMLACQLETGAVFPEVKAAIQYLAQPVYALHLDADWRIVHDCRPLR